MLGLTKNIVSLVMPVVHLSVAAGLVGAYKGRPWVNFSAEEVKNFKNAMDQVDELYPRGHVYRYYIDQFVATVDNMSRNSTYEDILTEIAVVLAIDTYCLSEEGLKATGQKTKLNVIHNFLHPLMRTVNSYMIPDPKSFTKIFTTMVYSNGMLINKKAGVQLVAHFLMIKPVSEPVGEVLASIIRAFPQQPCYESQYFLMNAFAIMDRYSHWQLEPWAMYGAIVRGLRDLDQFFNPYLQNFGSDRAYSALEKTILIEAFVLYRRAEPYLCKAVHLCGYYGANFDPDVIVKEHLGDGGKSLVLFFAAAPHFWFDVYEEMTTEVFFKFTREIFKRFITINAIQRGKREPHVVDKNDPVHKIPYEACLSVHMLAAFPEKQLKYHIQTILDNREKYESRVPKDIAYMETLENVHRKFSILDPVFKHVSYSNIVWQFLDRKTDELTGDDGHMHGMKEDVPGLWRNGLPYRWLYPYDRKKSRNK